MPEHLSAAMQRTAVAMHRFGFPLPAIAATVKADAEDVRRTICERRRVCVVPDCGTHLWSGNKTMVCGRHVHAPSYCGCARCKGRRGDA